MQTPFDPESRARELGLVLDPPATPLAAYIPAVRTGNLVFISGQVPIRQGSIMYRGIVGDGGVTLEQAQDCARQCAINGLAAVRSLVGSLNEVVRVVRAGCFVACGPGFGDQPKVANGASQLLMDVFGDAGKHARAAVGCPSLPLNVPVEIEFLFEVNG